MADEPGPRMSTASSRSAQSRRVNNPQQQVSQIEKSVTHLLVATKQLLETLTQWSRKAATDGDVSDVYVRLGYEFNIACRAFQAIGIPTDDLGPVPELLRAILEETLSHDASQASLDEYLPRIRDIIINLLHGLKRKQARLRSGRGGRDSSSTAATTGGSVRNPSVGSDGGAPAEDGPTRQSSGRPSIRRQASGDGGNADGPELPPRTSSTGRRTSPHKQDDRSAIAGISRTQLDSRDTLQSSDSSISSGAMQNMPIISPYPQEDIMPKPNQPPRGPPYSEAFPPPPPPPPPKPQDALAALQRGGELERRASRRFSAYQIQKHLGTSPNGMPAIPPSQNTPVPNRGRDVRESMNALRNRGSAVHGRPRSTNRPGAEAAGVPRKISEEQSSEPPASAPAVQSPQELPAEEASSSKIPVETPVQSPDGVSPGVVISATITTPVDDPAVQQGYDEQEKDTQHLATVPERRSSRKVVTPPPPATQQFLPDHSPQPGHELTLFLQYKSKIKKLVLPDGYNDLSLGRLQLAFIEKFAWNTHSNGNDLPEIYIQDPVSGVRHELEDLEDIKDRCVLVLNVEALDEVKRHIDEGIGGLRQVVNGIKTAMDDQQLALQRVSDRQQDAAKEIAGIAVAPRLSSARVSTLREVSPSTPRGDVDPKDVAAQLDEVQSLRRDLAVVRQTYQSFVSGIEASMGNVRTKAKAVKSTAIDVTMPKLDEGESGRAYILGDKKKLGEDCEAVINRVEELQDVVEDLRKDVVQRGVRPLPRQLDTVDRDISGATNEVRRLREVVKKAAPRWKRVWERELQLVCEEQEALSMQEALMADLSNDLEDSANTFALVQEATRQQNIMQNGTGSGGGGGGGRSASGRLQNAMAIDHVADPRKAKDTVLGEVRALQVNHEERVEAIERAEKARRRELEDRNDGEFKKELGAFVDEGKLKKSGGVEEAERLRRAKDERTRKEVWEQKSARERAREEKRKQKAAEKKAAANEVAEAAQADGAAEAGKTGGDVEVAAAEGDAGAEKEPQATVNGGEAAPV